MHNPYAQYQNTQIVTATPEKILIMLYDGAIRFSTIALDRLAKKDMAGKGEHIGKTLAIVSELMSTLNHEVGGDISLNLEKLYVYLMDELTQANINNSAASLENAISLLSMLRDTWVEAVEVLKKEREAAQSAIPMLAAG